MRWDRTSSSRQEERVVQTKDLFVTGKVTDIFLKYANLNKVIILSDNHSLSLPAATPPRLRAA